MKHACERYCKIMNLVAEGVARSGVFQPLHATLAIEFIKNKSPGNMGALITASYQMTRP